MTVKVSSIGLKSLEGYRVQVEVRISQDKMRSLILGAYFYPFRHITANSTSIKTFKKRPEFCCFF
ncbi:hypothetical protein NC797_15505 [Aquibacillus sp. 3ASR75-11]|uniref:Uncharacterized protein n=1 Tax=Terrihalobacillus insolitus TaxID=2950438 RepID=A0A9X3WX97_9BACI|nr:hypothetical protein [Terrihalobacillus insolitus]MDC3415035.1 hypothetical protein [Terrihalobacillus insolitus]MDC3425911.1 hypothetical protein [Terrihalobacillus insolitus]